jgi:hypothetical protein
MSPQRWGWPSRFSQKNDAQTKSRNRSFVGYPTKTCFAPAQGEQQMQSLSTAPYLWPLAIMLIGTAASLAGGALSGVVIGARHLGPKLAALMGAFFGPLAGATGLAFGVLVLALFGVRAG